MPELSRDIDVFLKRLFPIHRSITGPGNRRTLKILQEIIPLSVLEFPTGQRVFDWEIPSEWEIQDAWVKNDAGEKIVDYRECNLHVVGYSTPIHRTMTFEELDSHLYFQKDKPTAIPYRTNYYKRDWGFCLAYGQYRQRFRPGETYEVCIDSELKPGGLSLGEIVVPGRNPKEILISTYMCHPSMANDNLSGVVLSAFLAEWLRKQTLNFSYRFVFAPETIGAIAYCANRRAVIESIDCGLNVTCVGGPGSFGYKQSWQSSHVVNSIIEKTFRSNGIDFKTYPFDIHGSDERQYSSQGFRINMATITKDKYYEYDQYHTSLDDLSFVSGEIIAESLKLYQQVIERIDRNIAFVNPEPCCERMLGKHGLYPVTGGGFLPGSSEFSELDLMLWLLFYSDGENSIFSIAEKIGADDGDLYATAIKLEEKGLLVRKDPSTIP